MITRLRGLFRRYMIANLTLSGVPGPIPGLDGGRTTRIHWEAGRLSVEGHAPAGEIALKLGTMQTSLRIAAPDGPFLLVLPWPSDIPLRGAAAQLCPQGAPPMPVALQQVRRRQLRLALRFGLTALRLLPDLVGWIRRRDIACKARIKMRLGLGPPVADGPLDDTILATPDRPYSAVSSPVTIIVPVYNAPDLTRACLDRVARHTEGPWRMILIEDASTDPAVRPLVRDWVATRPEGQVELIEHDQNRGFIASVNAGFEKVLSCPAAETGPVVLLNTDALVPEGWLPRLLAPLEDPSVATVTPMSNDAEIFSVPAICIRSDLAPGMADRIDRVAATLNDAAPGSHTPTGVGFCMAMARPFLERVPGFDTVFGRGYGEEVDWCQKVRALGGRHLGTPRLFVEHRGGASFGLAEKRALIARNNARISARYPTYDREVQDFLLMDPLRSARMALGMAWAAAGTDRVPIYLAHSLGGGAEAWLQRQLQEDTTEGRGAVVLRVGGPARWKLEVVSANGHVAGWSGDFDLVTRFLAPLTRRRVIYSCGVGDPDPAELPHRLLELLQDAEDRLEVLFHDYFPISPSFTLLDGQGAYRGAPRPDHSGHTIRRPDGDEVTLPDWQAAWGRVLDRADDIRVFCPSSAALVTEVWPECATAITIAPHALPTEIAPLPVPPSQTPAVIGVLGNIAPHKGAGLVRDLARLAPDRRGFDMVLIGNIDPGFSLPRSQKVHGDYDTGDIPRLARHYGVTHWLIPSVWPETFSFTTHEALATGLPVLAFDIGAQGDAVAAAANGIPLRYDPDTDLSEVIVSTMKTERAGP